MTNEHNNQQASKAPIDTIRDGAMVVKLWEQHGRNGPYVTATLGRTYKNEQTGEYGESRSYSRNDLLKAGSLFHRANEAMLKWEDYYRQQNPEMNQQPDQGQAVQQQQSVQTHAAPQQAQQPQSMAEHRDQAMANAAPPQPVQGQPPYPER